MIQSYFTGCPIWRNKDWAGTLFKADAKAEDFLKQYSSVFNTVEGNSTFYSLPKHDVVRRWKQEVPSEFRFSFKFPRTISHHLKLNSTQEETTLFFKTLEPLAEQLGVFFLQLPPSFDKTGLKQLGKFLRTLPQDFQYAVEVRHLDYFDQGEVEQYFHELLRHFQANRVMFDTSTLHQLQTGDVSVLEAQRKKPKVPERFIATGIHPFLRFVGSNQVEPNLARLKHIAGITANWIDQGLHPYIFMHAPDDKIAPELCRVFHRLLSERVKEHPIGQIPNWPGEQVTTQQLSLF